MTPEYEKTLMDYRELMDVWRSVSASNPGIGANRAFLDKIPAILLPQLYVDGGTKGWTQPDISFTEMLLV